MKKNYEMPMCSVQVISLDDILTTSPANPTTPDIDLTIFE